MYVCMQIILLLVLALSAHLCRGFYIRKGDESPTDVKASIDSPRDEWGVFQNRLGLSNEKVELLKSQKDQLGTKLLLHRFIMENPKYLGATGSRKKKLTNKLNFKKLFRAVMKNLKSSESSLKTSFKFELMDGPKKHLKRTRRKIAVRMVSDMSSDRVDQLLKMFYQKHNIQPSSYVDDRFDRGPDNDEYGDADAARQASMEADLADDEPDYDYDNLYDDERDVGLIAKSHQNSEYGSFQDLILQAKRNQWEQESEENKLHSPHNDHFI